MYSLGFLFFCFYVYYVNSMYNAVQCMRMLIGSFPAVSNFGCHLSTKALIYFVVISC